MNDLTRTSQGQIPDGFEAQIAALEQDGAKKLNYTPRAFSKDLVCVIPDVKVKYFESRETFSTFRDMTLRNPSLWGHITWMKYPRLKKIS